jgi:3-phosphoglycerate kinase
MNRKTLIASLIQVANEIDDLDFYDDANELTQAAEDIMALPEDQIIEDMDNNSGDETIEDVINNIAKDKFTQQLLDSGIQVVQ